MKTITLDKLNELPSVSGIYFVYLDDLVLYIGKSKNINQRWRNHHRFNQLFEKYTNALIAWYEIDAKLLTIHENSAIATFNPLLNNTKQENWVNAVNKRQKSNNHGLFDLSIDELRDIGISKYNLGWIEKEPKKITVDGKTLMRYEIWQLVMDDTCFVYYDFLKKNIYYDEDFIYDFM